jgi:hypothetical protein
MRIRMLWLIAGIAAVGAVVAGPVMSDVEQAKYTVIRTQGDNEIRDYTPAIVAETTISGEREEAIKKGFRIIADYIFGNNISSEKVAMTAPAIQKSSEKIAMTAPVVQQPKGNQWTVHFVMPASYSMASLPKPNNPEVVLKQIPGKRFAVERFSGTASEDSLKEHSQALMAFVQEQKLHALSAPLFAFYNPPWTLPLLRRNEVMVEIAH